MRLFFPIGPDEAVVLMQTLRELFGTEKLHVELYPLASGLWLFLSSLLPVWTQSEQIARKIEIQNFSQAKLLAHARAASNKAEIGDIELNMPFKIDIDGEILSFAFNGRFSGATAKIIQEELNLTRLGHRGNGAQLLKNLLQRLLQRMREKEPGKQLSELVPIALEQLEAALHKVATITGCNIVIQGRDFTCYREMKRDKTAETDEEQKVIDDYYTMYSGIGYIASADSG